jgi:signal transduction histidine kinase
VRTRTLLEDGALAAAVLVVGMFGTAGADRVQDAPRAAGAPAYLLVVLACLPLVARRRAPVPVLAATTAAAAVYVGAGYAYGPILIALFVALYTAASARASLVPAAAAAGVALAALAVRLARDPNAVTAVSLVPFGSWLLVPLTLGMVVRLRRDAGARSRREVAAAAATEERLRVAREVHDVAGHGFAVIAMQAGVALHVLDRRPEQARVALEEIRAASRESLASLRSTLEVVAGDTDPERRAPAAGLGELDGLLTRMRQAGLDVELDVTGERRPLPADADLAAYRILQESLTNVLRHAGASTARVSLAYGDADLAVRVEDDGTGPAQDPTGGRGIAGMRDRAAAAGGSLEAGPRPGGGFRVAARIPAGRA